MDPRMLGRALVVVGAALPRRRRSVATRQPDKCRALCSACHIVGTERIGSDVAPPFATIALT